MACSRSATDWKTPRRRPPSGQREEEALDGVEETDELLVPVLGHAAAQHGAVPDIERGEQGGDAVALVAVRHGAPLAS